MEPVLYRSAHFIKRLDENIVLMQIDSTDEYYLWDQSSDENTLPVMTEEEAIKQYEFTKTEFDLMK